MFERIRGYFDGCEKTHIALEDELDEAEKEIEVLKTQLAQYTESHGHCFDRGVELQAENANLKALTKKIAILVGCKVE